MEVYPLELSWRQETQNHDTGSNCNSQRLPGGLLLGLALVPRLQGLHGLRRHHSSLWILSSPGSSSVSFPHPFLWRIVSLGLGCNVIQADFIFEVPKLITSMKIHFPNKVIFRASGRYVFGSRSTTECTTLCYPFTGSYPLQKALCYTAQTTLTWMLAEVFLFSLR